MHVIADIQHKRFGEGHRPVADSVQGDCNVAVCVLHINPNG